MVVVCKVIKSGQIEKIKTLSYIDHGVFDVIKCLYLFDDSLGARAEICQMFSLLFWSKRWQPKDILNLTDL